MRQFYAIIGHPVAHSLSPKFQQAAFEKAGIDAAYLPFDLPPVLLAKGIAALRTLGVSGFNITLPHKEAMVAHVDTIGAVAAEIGAVNTVISHNGNWHGENTDGPGFLEALERFISKNELSFPSRVLIFGAGGSARAALWALSRRPVSELFLVNRTLARGQDLLALPFLSGIASRRAVTPEDPLWKEWLLASSGTLLINTLSIQAFQGAPHPFPPLADLSLSGSLLFDLSYVGGQKEKATGLTPFLRMGTSFRTPRQNGLGMLLCQGALSFELWTGGKAPARTMEEALLTSTGQRNLWKSL